MIISACIYLIRLPIKTNMSFERLAFQVWMETTVGCTTPDNWASHRDRLKNFQISPEQKNDAIAATVRDASSLFHKALLTFASAYTDIHANNRAWSVVKLYYSMFYAIRARLLARRHALVRNKCWYHFDLNDSKPIAHPLNSTRYRNDHEATLHLYEDIFSSSDRLLSNDIEGIKPFAWMMELRNIANYRAARFADPDFLFDFAIHVQLLNAAALDALIAQNLNDVTDILVFQPEHAWLALPMKQLVAACNDLAIAGSPLALPADQLQHTIGALNSLPNTLRTALEKHAIFRSIN